jgi:hypothetical protein
VKQKKAQRKALKLADGMQELVLGGWSLTEHCSDGVCFKLEHKETAEYVYLTQWDSTWTIEE